ncbi:helix-turn-helix domain-containing protein [Burkholderia pseudomallei]|uniref:helix-turn-helix domain-containing protein n=1 Tax=Burkholderia pseudomallei TaxID=28450 RepID=UPI000F0979FC|nr:helix-turn-helix transcriptional regulator [Burkholderia pseudomallei]MWA18095.1 helix-turn-helix domain-containing protein [Burkholderia pseudomallei]
MPAKPLTPEQLEDAARLRVLFKKWQQQQKDLDRPSSQMEAAAQLGFNQSALSQYLRGEIPLNIRVIAKFVALLNCKAEEISPTLAENFADLVSAIDLSTNIASTGERVSAQMKNHSLTANSGNTKEVVNPSIHPNTKHVHNTNLQIAQRFSKELLAAVSEGRVTDELLDTLVKVFRMGTSINEAGPQGNQHHTKMVKVRGSRKRGTDT